MTSQLRAKIGAALLIVAVLVVSLLLFVRSDGDELLVVQGAVGSEKSAFLQNPEVQEILANRYGLRVDFTAAGSVEIVENSSKDRDFVWPASPITIDERYYPAANSQEIFYSPVVLYSWAPVADGLVAAGLVEQIDGTYYVSDFPRLVQMIDEGVRWEEVGLPQLADSISITTTDPTTSNSGSSFAGLLATTYNGDRVVDITSVEMVLDQVRAFFSRIGPLENTTADLFDRFVNEGMVAYPVIAGYEASLIEFSFGEEESVEHIRDEFRLLYPRPTIWSSHPVIALTPNGEKLLTALTDADLQRIAWERHGFRPGLFRNPIDPNNLGIAGIPSTTDLVMPLPRAAVMNRIIEALQLDAPNSPTPIGSPTADLSRSAHIATLRRRGTNWFSADNAAYPQIVRDAV